jgi:hypothetical protein
MSAAGGRGLGFLAALMLRLFGRKRKVTPDDLRKMEFPTSTQRMGLRFTEKLRDTFRPRWLRRK